MKELTILLPAYNEESNIEDLVMKWQDLRDKLLEKCNVILKLLIINDGSIDNTLSVCENLRSKYNNIVIINNKQNSGLGSTLKTGLIHILKSKSVGGYICTMDSDNTHNPIYILNLFDKIMHHNNINGADVVIASRFSKGSLVKGLSYGRVAISTLAKLYYCTFFRIRNVHDYTCGYRLYTVEAMRKLYAKYGEYIVNEKGFSCMPELLWKMNKIDAIFDEVPFVLQYDLKKGPSKMKIFRTIYDSVKLIFSLRKQYKESI